jgi:hypothetical protein
MTNDPAELRIEAPRVQRLGLQISKLLFVAFSLGLMPVNMHAAQSASAPDRDSFLKAVAEVETGGNSRAIGRRGERGLYQFSLGTWRQYTTQPFSAAHDPVTAYDIAVRHFGWLQDRLVAQGRKPTAYQLAVAWNGGLNRALSGRFPKSTREYAGRVSNLSEVYARAIPNKTRKSVTEVAANSPAPRSPSALDLSFKSGDALVDSASDAPTIIATSEVATEMTFSLSPSGAKSPADSKSE